MKQKIYIFFLLSFFISSAYGMGVNTNPPGPQFSGINVSWLEQYWNLHALDEDKLTERDLNLMVKLGIKTIRLPVAFQKFYINADMSQKAKLLLVLDKVIKKTARYKIKLILVNHYGILRADHLQADTQVLLDLWSKLEKQYRKISNNTLYFELLNEPEITDDLWFEVAEKLIRHIRKLSPGRTIILGASNYNSIYELSRLVPLKLKNIIYTFHFYEPFVFTHQGADWVGKQVSTTGIPFPFWSEQMPKLNEGAKGTAGEANYKNYPNEGKVGALHDKLMIAKRWADRYQVTILCGEYGVYRKFTNEQSICNYLTGVKSELDLLSIPGIIWDYNDNFSIFNGKPDIKNLSPCMLKLFGK